MSQASLIKTVTRYSQRVTADYVALHNSGTGEKTEYSTTVSRSKKPGKPGKIRRSAYNLIEAKLDLDLAIKQGDYDTAIPLYFYLKNRIGWPPK